MNASRSARFAFAVVLVGLAAAAFAIAFRFLLRALMLGVFGTSDVVAAFAGLSPTLRLVTPAIGGLVAGVLAAIASRQSTGHGVADVLEAVVLGRGRIPLRGTLLKALGSFAAIAAGGSVGREGPLIQFGAGAAGAIGSALHFDRRRVRILVAAGTAAGFAAAYNTPLAAIVFVLEIVTGVIALPVVVPVVVATVIATSLTRLALGAGPIYGLRTFRLVSSSELLAFACVGLAAGLIGPAFMASLGGAEKQFGRLNLPRPALAASGGAIVGVIAVVWPEVTGNGYEPIQGMLEARFTGTLLATLLVAKAIATTSSVASGSPGGVFTPSMFLGAAAGGLVGSAVSAVLPASLHGGQGGYSLVGMAAMIAATTHAPIMAAVLVFELSGDYAVVLPLLICTTLATAVARRCRPDSIYTEELRRRGTPWEGTISERLAKAVRARDIMEMDPAFVAPTTPLSQALELLERGDTRVVYTVRDKRVAALDLHAAKQAWAALARGEEAADETTVGARAREVPVLAPDDTLPSMSERLASVQFGEVPVVDPAKPGVILGVVTRRAVLAAFDAELLQRDILFTRVVWSEAGREASDYLELPSGHHVEIIAAPASLVGRDVDVGALRREFLVTLIGVRRSTANAPPAWVDPMANPSVRDGDRWMVVGTHPSIEKLRKARP